MFHPLWCLEAQRKGMVIIMEKQFKAYDDLPLMLSVQDVAAVLGISRAGAYELVKSEGFPAMNIGSRIIVPKEEFILWIKQKVSGKK